MADKRDNKLKEVIEALSRHAESLQAGLDAREALLADQPERRGMPEGPVQGGTPDNLGTQVLAGLFDLAGRVRNTLRPVEPAPNFVADLKKQLLQNAERARAVTQRERTVQQRALILAVILGSGAYVLGLISIVARSGISMAALISALVGRRRAQPAGDV